MIRRGKKRKQKGLKSWDAWIQLTPGLLELFLCPDCLNRLMESLGGCYTYIPSKRKLIVKERIEKIKEMMKEKKTKKEIMKALDIKSTGAMLYYLRKILKE